MIKVKEIRGNKITKYYSLCPDSSVVGNHTQRPRWKLKDQDAPIKSMHDSDSLSSVVRSISSRQIQHPPKTQIGVDPSLNDR